MAASKSLMYYQNLINERKASLGLMTVCVLFITGVSLLSLMALGEWFGWLPDPVYFLLPIIVFMSLSYLVVKYGYKNHTNTDGRKIRTILMIAGIILMSVPSAYIVNQYLWRTGVINGLYPLSEYNATDTDLYNVARLKVYCLSISFLVFLGIAFTTWIYREKFTTLKGLLIVNLILLFVSLWTIQIVDSQDKSWYYGNEKVLNNNIEQYYAQITQLDSICNNYSVKVTRLYDQHLVAELRDFRNGNQDPLPENAPLKERHKRYDEMQSWLFNYVCETNMLDGPVKKIWEECGESEEKLRRQIHAIIDIQKIQNIQNSMHNIENNLRDMDYDQVNNGSVYREQVNVLTSIAGDLNHIGFSFIRYMNPEAPLPVYHDIDKITYEATDELQLVGRRLSYYNENFHNK